MRSLMLAAIAALVFVSAAYADKLAGGGGSGKSPVADSASPVLYDRASPNLFDKQHAAAPHCKTGKPCGHGCIKSSDVCPKH